MTSNRPRVFNTWDVSTLEAWYAECAYWRERAKREGRTFTVLTPVQRAKGVRS